LRCWVKITAVTTQKNEGAFLLEWIAYYKILGFADLVILSNDGEDGSDEMLDHLSKSVAIIHLRNIVKSVDPTEFFQATRFLPAITALTSNDPATEFYKLQRGRRDMLRHLCALLGHAKARPGPLLTNSCANIRCACIQPPPKLVAALQQVEQTAAE
jgi:hypothetical protein